MVAPCENFSSDQLTNGLMKTIARFETARFQGNAQRPARGLSIKSWSKNAQSAE
jgi:hypothetical protein